MLATVIIPQAGFDPPFTEGAEFTEGKTDALANQATTAGFCLLGCLWLSFNFTVYSLKTCILWS